AVGDKGAIVRFGGAGGLSAARDEPKPPLLGDKTESTLPDDSAYDGYRPLSLTAKPGVVPPLETRPLVQLSQPEFIPAGTPDATRSLNAPVEDVSKIVMSRDGNEGWAIGSGPESAGASTTLFHYNGSRWTSCDPV